jgi:hypothetical protein
LPVDNIFAAALGRTWRDDDMDEFNPTFSNVEKDIERYLEQFGVRDTLSNGTPVIRGFDKAQQTILDLYYQQQAYDALVAYLLTFNWELGNGEFLLELSDALVRKKDVRRLKRLWHGVIAKQKIHFWQYKASPVVSGTVTEATAKAKARILGTLTTMRDLMLQLGEAQEAQKLNDDLARIEKEEKGKALPKPIDRSMDESCFWDIIEKSKENASSTAEQIELLIAELELFKATEIGKFHKLLQQKMAELYHWDIWAVAYLAQGGCSDDAFEAFPPWIILQGPAVYQLALKDVTKLSAHVPSGGETQADGLLFAPAIAYENRAGKPMRPGKAKALKIRGKPWDESELQSRYPELYRRYS